MSATAAASRKRRATDVAIAVQLAVGARGIPSRARLIRWARAAAPAGAEVTLRIVGGAEGRRLNRGFRGRDYATDVLTFVYEERSRGDIVLCHPVLARAARERAVPLAAHYAHLVVHGMLHLRGFDHERARDARRMERAEAGLLAGFGFANPYAVESPLRVRAARPRRA